MCGSRSGLVLREVQGQDVDCSFIGPEFADADAQAVLVQQLVDQGNVDGLAIAITKPSHGPTLEAIASAVLRGIPVITFDSDDPTSDGLAYVGTNNWAFGTHSTPINHLNIFSNALPLREHSVFNIQTSSTCLTSVRATSYVRDTSTLRLVTSKVASCARAFL